MTGNWGPPPPPPPPPPSGKPPLNGFDKALNIIGFGFLLIVAAFVALFVLRWAYTEYYIATHCTMVLGTRVCQ